MALQIESLYVLDGAGRIAYVNDGRRTPPPRLALVLSPSGPRALVSAAVPAATAAQLLAAAAGEPAWNGDVRGPRLAAEYRRILESEAPVTREESGPAFVLPRAAAGAAGAARVLGTGEQRLLARHFSGWARDFEPSRPIAVVVEDGAAVSVCGCARRKTRAVEAGVETAEAYRGRGYAGVATAAWAGAIIAEGRIPLYSTSWENAPSQRVAASLGAVQYAVDCSVG